mmetsp:Transcript_108429/g.197341  ORF Transcript_108429/g.197341 Transcript_108429/m.197341 type:complete len:114 (-) Transcript_108429:257-598(-)
MHIQPKLQIKEVHRMSWQEYSKEVVLLQAVPPIWMPTLPLAHPMSPQRRNLEDCSRTAAHVHRIKKRMFRPRTVEERVMSCQARLKTVAPIVWVMVSMQRLLAFRLKDVHMMN